MEIPEWAKAWFKSGDSGVSSKAIFWHMLGDGRLTDLHDMDAPYDLYDVWRCMDLLDLAAENVQDWRARMGEMSVYPAWAPIAARWADIEAANLRDRAAHDQWEKARWRKKDGTRRANPKKIEHPKLECNQLLQQLRGFQGRVRVSQRPFVSDVVSMKVCTSADYGEIRYPFPDYYESQAVLRPWCCKRGLLEHDTHGACAEQ